MDKELNWTGRLARYFIVNGKLTGILMLGLFVWGIFGYFQTPKKYNPTIVAPAFKVTVEYPGASKSEVLEQVTKPLENVITDISGVEDVYSVTMQGGASQVFVNFFVGEDLDSAKIALNDRLQSDSLLAPIGTLAPVVVSLDPEDVPVITIALSSKSMQGIELRRLAFVLKDHLAEVEGISRLSVVGGNKRELRIEVDPDLLAKYAVSIQQLEASLKDNNIYFPSGVIKGADRYTQVQANAWVNTPEEVEEIIVISNDNINIHVKDLARVYEAEEEVDFEVRHSVLGEDVGETVLLSLAKLKGTNISDVTDRVIAELDKVKKDILPENVKAKILVNDGNTASSEISALMTNLLTSVLIVIAVLFLFLNAKASMLVAISIPLTLATVFGAANIAGQDINRITLFALILSLGLLVDNATVVIENIIRKVGEEKRVTVNTFARAVSEVGIGLFMATITTVLAFIPMKFIGGMMGPYMGPIPFFVPAALIAALFISYSINPWMASVLIKKNEAEDHKPKAPSKWQQLGTHFLLLYRRLIRNLMKDSKKGATFLISTLIVLMVVLTFPALQLVKFRMLPKADVDQFFVHVDLPAGSSLTNTEKTVRLLEESILKQKHVVMIQSYIGTPPILDFNGLFKGVESRKLPHQATLRVGLESDNDRELSSEQIVLKLRPILNKLVSHIPGVRLKLIEDPPGPPVRSTLLVRVQTSNEALLKKEAMALKSMVSSIEETVDHDISHPDDSEEIRVTIDHLACSRSRVAPGQVVDALNAFYSGRMAGVYHSKGLREQEFITIRLKKDLRMDEDLLSKIMIPNSRRINIPLSKVAKLEKANSNPPLLRENHLNTIYLTTEMGDRSVTYAGVDLLMELYSYKLSNAKAKLKSWDLFGMHYQTENNEDVYITIGGEWELTLEVFRDLIIAMVIAIMAIYLVLVGQFKSFIDALLIMSTIPLSTIGIMPGFALMGAISGEYFTATSMIGVIALAGIAVNNAIIMLEYINLTKGRSDNLIENLTEAAATRLRPIALTTITTVLGSLTIISDPVWSGLAWAIVWGLAVSSTLILFVFPLLYHFVHRNKWKNTELS